MKNIFIVMPQQKLSSYA